MKQRIITGIILILIVFWAIFALSPKIFPLALGILVLGCSWEWSRFFKTCLSGSQRFLYMASILVGLLLSQQFVGISFLASLGFWLLVIVGIYQAQKQNKPMELSDFGIGLAGFFVLVPFYNAIMQLWQTAPWLIIVLLLITAFADTGAYFLGRAIGKKPLAPTISPKKTVEGLIGGMISASVGVLALSWLMVPLSWAQYIALAVVTFFLALLSVIGDLFESVLKRQRGLKDSGYILPGHGGLLDRLDSVFAVAPAFTIFGILAQIVVFVPSFSALCV